MKNKKIGPVEPIARYKISQLKGSKDGQSKTETIPQTRAKLKELTVLFYLDGQSNLEPWTAPEMFNLEKLGSDTNVNILVQMGRAPQGKFYPEEIKTQIDGDWSGVRRYYVIKNNPEIPPVTSAEFRQAVQNAPDNPIVRFDYAELLSREGYTKEAQLEYKQAEELGIEKYCQGIDLQQRETWEAEELKATQFINDRRAKDSKYASTLIKDLGEDASIQYPENLKNFIEWGIKNYPAKHYALVMMQHGEAWNLSSLGNMSPSQINMAVQKAFKEALQPKDKLDILLFNSCYMGNLEALRELKDSAEIAIASENYTLTSAFKESLDVFKELKEKLNEGEKFDAQTFSKNLVKHFQEKGQSIQNLPFAKRFTGESYLTLSAVNTDKLDEVSLSWNNLLSDWKKLNLPANKLFQILSSSKNYLFTVTTPEENITSDRDLRDLGDIAKKIAEDKNLPEEIRNDAKNLLNCINEAVIAEQHTGIGPDKAEMEGSTGLTIWGPTDIRSINALLRSYYSNVPEFIKESQWDDFLASMFNEKNIDNLKKFNKILHEWEKTKIWLENGKNLTPEKKAELTQKYNELTQQLQEIYNSFDLTK